MTLTLFKTTLVTFATVAVATFIVLAFHPQDPPFLAMLGVAFGHILTLGIIQARGGR